MDGQREGSGAHFRNLPPQNVRLLTNDEELAAAIARAEEGARRLRDRLAARAARDAWMAEHDGQRVGWLRFVRGVGGTGPMVTPAGARPVRPAAGEQGRRSSSPAA